MACYYNEIDPYAAQWLRNLIDAGHIAPGVVDERSILDVQRADLAGYTQCHFFAGIGGWSLALRIAGVADAAEVWTGSPPCQDNSVMSAVYGRRVGLDGDRSGLAIKWLELVDGRRPSAVTFENVPGIAPWLTEITGRLARSGYRVSESKRSSASVGAPHLRRRVWLLAERDGSRLQVTGRPEPSVPTRDPRAAAPRGAWASTPSGFRPLDDGLSSRVGGVHAAGNAIDPWAAAAALVDMKSGNVVPQFAAAFVRAAA